MKKNWQWVTSLFNKPVVYHIQVQYAYRWQWRCFLIYYAQPLECLNPLPVQYQIMQCKLLRLIQIWLCNNVKINCSKKVLLWQFPKIYFSGPGQTWSNSRKIGWLTKIENSIVPLKLWPNGAIQITTTKSLLLLLLFISKTK